MGAVHVMHAMRSSHARPHPPTHPPTPPMNALCASPESCCVPFLTAFPACKPRLQQPWSSIHTTCARAICKRLRCCTCTSRAAAPRSCCAALPPLTPLSPRRHMMTPWRWRTSTLKPCKTPSGSYVGRLLEIARREGGVWAVVVRVVRQLRPQIQWKRCCNVSAGSGGKSESAAKRAARS